MIQVSSVWNLLPHRALLMCFALIIFLLNLFYLGPSAVRSYNDGSHSSASSSTVCHIAPTPDPIPNNVHFVYILADPVGDFTFKFKHFLSVYAAWYYWQPDLIYLHTNAHEQAIARARDGHAGKWSKLIFTAFDSLGINIVEAPTHTNTGVEIKGLEHKSDFVRVKAVHEIGGVYIDFDVHALRDIRVLRESGFKAVAGRQFGGQINSGVFMSIKGGRMVELWMHGMHEAYTGGWTTHSNEVITKLSQRLVREPSEILIMERDAFAPGSWKNGDTDNLFRPHDDNLTSTSPPFTDGETLPKYEETFDERWEMPHNFPDWARDWSSSYLLHAFTADRWNHKIDNFTQITPRYVLERKSNFARAVYPVAREMYETGLIGVDDSYDGL